MNKLFYRKFSVNIKVNSFIGNILRNKFYASCYVLLSDTRPWNR